MSTVGIQYQRTDEGTADQKDKVCAIANSQV
jgi:hypothetical protein